MPDLLLEILSEEIPARMQPKARADLQALVLKGLSEAGVAHGEASVASTPRRLVLRVKDLPARTEGTVEARKGPRVDAPEKALEGFLRSAGVGREDLERRADKKGEVWFATIRRPGRDVSDVLAEVVADTIRGFPWPKSMRWGAGDLRWVRPLVSILCLLDDRVVPVEVEGVPVGRVTKGHPIHDPEPFEVSGWEEYAAGLADRHVILDHEARRTLIDRNARALAEAQGVALVEDEALLTEVTGLTEWPVPLVGAIEDAFLDLPAEVLTTSMREHQKYFSATDAEGRVTHFVAVANTEAEDAGATILQGNMRVLRARLADAKFFHEADLRAVRERGLEGMAEALSGVTFHNRLGSQAERIERIAVLAGELAPVTGADPEQARLAARVAKADLASAMVYEFPELQGTMGRYYALAQGLPEAVATACEAHYRPLGPSDAVPDHPVGMAVALADKIDLLAGFWAIDEKPTGSKDPFALRRAALGVIRIVLENGLRLRLGAALGVALVRHSYLIGRRDAQALGQPLLDALEGFGLAVAAASRQRFEEAVAKLLSPGSGLAEAVEPGFRDEMREKVSDLLGFVADRLKVALRERGIRHDLIDAVFALGDQDDLVGLVRRVEALQAFLGTEDGANLLAAYKRAANILSAEAKKEGGLPASAVQAAPDPARAVQDEERALFEALAAVERDVAPALAAEDFEGAMARLAALRGPVDAFFEAVTVNADDPALRANRLALLARIRAVTAQVADFSRIEG